MAKIVDSDAALVSKHRNNMKLNWSKDLELKNSAVDRRTSSPFQALKSETSEFAIFLQSKETKGIRVCPMCLVLGQLLKDCMFCKNLQGFVFNL